MEIPINKNDIEILTKHKKLIKVQNNKIARTN